MMPLLLFSFIAFLCQWCQYHILSEHKLRVAALTPTQNIQKGFLRVKNIDIV